MRNQTWVFFAFLFALAASNSSCVRPLAVVSHQPKVALIDEHVLVSKASHIKYVIDSAETYIAAIDSFGHVLWKKDPWLDYKIWPYFFPRTNKEAEQLKNNREPIQGFYLDTLAHNGYRDDYRLEKGDEVIRIGYGNMFGFIDVKNGEFHCQGQD